MAQMKYWNDLGQDLRVNYEYCFVLNRYDVRTPVIRSWISPALLVEVQMYTNLTESNERWRSEQAAVGFDAWSTTED